jgi:hypothetical protein
VTEGRPDTTTRTPAEESYLAAATELRALFGPPVVDVEAFTTRTLALVKALEGLEIADAHLAPVRKLRDDAIRAAGATPLFRGIVGLFLQQLRAMGVLPQSHAETADRTLARLSSLADLEAPVMSERPTSRRATHVARPPLLSPRTAVLMEPPARVSAPPAAPRETAQGESRSDTLPPPDQRPSSASYPPARPSSGSYPPARPSSASLPAARTSSGRLAAASPAAEAEHRLVVLEEPADASAPIAIKSSYRVNPRPIGEGGASKVYAARDVDTGLRVAVKVVTIPDPAKRALWLGLFQNEREIQGSLEDDSIVRIYKAGLTGHGEPYIVLELLTGGSLEGYIEELRKNPRRFEPNEVRQVAAMTVASVAVAHRRGVVHKDVKPANFLFTEDRRRLKLGDFGIAERKEQISAGLNGTIGYIPPETFQGVLDAEPRDVFALGVTLYELFSSALPFDVESAAASYHDMIGRAPQPPSKRRPDRAVGEDVDRIVLRALAKEPADRYANADEMLFDLLTAGVRATMERARAARDLPADDPTAPDPQARATLFARTVRDAIRELEHIAEAFPGERMRALRLDMLVELHRHADLAGDEPLVRETADSIARLSPRHELVQESATSITIDFVFDDPRSLLRRARPRFTQIELEDRAGVILEKSADTSPHFFRTLELARGQLLALGVRGEGIRPVQIPLPVRPGRHRVRVPIYAEDEAPEGGVIVSAGWVPARNRRGSLWEAIDPVDLRRVERDFAIGNLVTQAEWLSYLEVVADQDGPEAAQARTPSSWRATRGGWREDDGAALDLRRPVRNVSYRDALDWLARAPHAPTGARLPTLNETKRACRGNDARVFPWGDAPGRRPSIAAFQFLGFAAAMTPMPSAPDDARFADRSPFSPREGPAAFHLVGNLSQMLSIGVSQADRALIVGAFPITRGEDPADPTLAERFFVTFGLPFDRSAPTNSDVIGVERGFDPEHPARRAIVPHGFRWVVPLRAPGASISD